MSLEKIRLRHVALRAIREHFVARDFIEVDTPLLVAHPGLEPHIDPLTVRVRVDASAPSDETVERWLITSAELALKKLVAAGAERIFQLSHVFRDGEHTRLHRPEFTMLEWYAAGVSLDDTIAETHALIRSVHRALTSWDAALTGAALIDVHAPLERATCSALFAQHAGVDLRAALERMRDGDERALVDAVTRAGFALRPNADFEDAFFQVMGDRVEPAIGRASLAVVTEWPAQMAALAKRNSDGLTCARFEMYAGGLELCNAYDELTDPVEQRARFTADNAKRVALGKRALPVDEEFLAALARCPPMCGNALGVDRLLMVLTGAALISDVVL